MNESTNTTPEISEEKTIRKFINAIDLYPFATHIEREVVVGSGRADIRLPDYDVVIEAKGSNGDLKSAIGQVIWYSRHLDDEPYILAPPSELTNELVSVCEDECIGLITVSKMCARLVNDIGGFNAFQLYDFNGPKMSDSQYIGKPQRTDVVGGEQPMIAEEDNLTREMMNDGKLVLEPGYAGYLRSQGHIIEDIHSVDVVASDSEPDKKYLVAKIDTYDLPMSHSDLDVAADGITLPVCTCWSWRSNSADLDEQQPSECRGCKHTRKAYREARAEADDSQATL